MGVSEEKKEWLKSIGAVEFEEPIKYVYTFRGYNGAFNLSERHIEDTPLEELKAQYAENEAYVNSVLESRKSQGISD